MHTDPPIRRQGQQQSSPNHYRQTHTLPPVRTAGRTPSFLASLLAAPQTDKAAGREGPADDTHLSVDEGRDGEVVKEVREELPDVGVPVLAVALVVEAVHLHVSHGHGHG